MKSGHRLFIIGAEMTMVRKGLACAAVIVILLAPATARAQDDEVVYFHTDASGSVRMITSATGVVIGRYDFLPFGELWPANPPAPTESRQFTGAERDADTKLDYFGARYYRPISGRFTTVDPGHVAGSLYDPQSWNAYAYALNNPFRFVDPFGLAPCPAPTDTSTCVEGRRGTGEFAIDFTLWLFQAQVWEFWNSLREPPPNGVMGAMPAPPFFSVGQMLGGSRRMLAGSIRNVNPLGSATNCVNCAIATDATLAGRPASALPSGLTSPSVLEIMYGGRFARVSGRAAIEAQLASAGPGARGIILAIRGPGQPSHVFNGVNQGGTIRFLDGQSGTAASFQGFREFYLLWTRP